MDRVRNEEMSRRAGTEMELASKTNQRVLRLFGYVLKNGRVPYGQNGVDGGSKWRAGGYERDRG